MFVQEVCKRIAVAFNVLRVPTMGQTADRAQKTHAGALKPHTPTGAGPRLSHRITQFAFQVSVVQVVKPINEEITGMIPTEEIMHLLHAWIRGVPHLISMVDTCLLLPKFTHQLGNTIRRTAGVMH
jgi:hypothetical protein